MLVGQADPEQWDVNREERLFSRDLIRESNRKTYSLDFWWNFTMLLLLFLTAANKTAYILFCTLLKEIMWVGTNSLMLLRMFWAASNSTLRNVIREWWSRTKIISWKAETNLHLFIGISGNTRVSMTRTAQEHNDWRRPLKWATTNAWIFVDCSWAHCENL